MTDTNTALAQRPLSDRQLRTRLELAQRSFGLQQANQTQRVLPLRRTDIDTDVIVRLYRDDVSTLNISKLLGCSLCLVMGRLRRAGVMLRGVGSYGHRKGETHSNWKGSEGSYTAKHARVRRRRGKADHCEQCGADDPTKRYEWANLTGNYDDINDYRAMCVHCHRVYDDKGLGRGASRRRL